MQTTLFASLIALPMSLAVAQDTTSDEAPATEAPSTTTEETATEQPSTDDTTPASDQATPGEKAPAAEEAPAAEAPPAAEEAPAVEKAAAPTGTSSANPAVAAKMAKDEAPLSRVELRHIPPRFSYDLGIQFGYGEITYWKEEVPAWATLGFAMAWGKHFDSHRIGMGFAFVAEGPIPVHSSVFFEPSARWDAVLGWLQIGASVGPGVSFHHAQRTVVHESKWDVGPVGSLRVGWSQPYTRLGRRLHVVLEPKVRLVDGRMNPTVAVFVGSGRGY